jgi:hypothetical protein
MNSVIFGRRFFLPKPMKLLTPQRFLSGITPR